MLIQVRRSHLVFVTYVHSQDIRWVVEHGGGIYWSYVHLQ